MPGALALLRTLSRTNTLLLSGGIVVALIAYAVFLVDQQNRAEARLEHLRVTDRTGYLEQIRKLDGFDAYLAEFAKHQNFDTEQTVAPAFMIGRWSLRDEPERISAMVRLECHDPITFEYGRLEIPDDDIRVRATYTINGDTLVVSPATRDAFRVKLVSYGSRIDHLELTPPGRDKVFYAYPCEM